MDQDKAINHLETMIRLTTYFELILDGHWEGTSDRAQAKYFETMRRLCLREDPFSALQWFQKSASSFFAQSAADEKTLDQCMGLKGGKGSTDAFRRFHEKKAIGSLYRAFYYSEGWSWDSKRKKLQKSVRAMKNDYAYFLEKFENLQRYKDETFDGSMLDHVHHELISGSMEYQASRMNRDVDSGRNLFFGKEKIDELLTNEYEFNKACEPLILLKGFAPGSLAFKSSVRSLELLIKENNNSEMGGVVPEK